MRSETRTRITELAGFSWFENAGHCYDKSPRLAKTWQEAVEYCGSNEWESFHLQLNNALGIVVSRFDYDRFEQWNETVEEIKVAVAPILAREVLSVAKANKLPLAFQVSVLWDLLGICLETEFSDICTPVFYLPQLLPVYRSGHFPCGWDGPKLADSWEGSLPPGKLIVY